MGFSGWPLEAVEFFRGLQADNTKTYWNVYKAPTRRRYANPWPSCSPG
jgi:hypothetical protein